MRSKILSAILMCAFLPFIARAQVQELSRNPSTTVVQVGTNANNSGTYGYAGAQIWGFGGEAYFRLANSGSNNLIWAFGTNGVYFTNGTYFGEVLSAGGAPLVFDKNTFPTNGISAVSTNSKAPAQATISTAY